MIIAAIVQRLTSALFAAIFVICAVVCAGGCAGSRPPPPTNLPPPVNSTTVGPEDVFEVNVYSEPTWPKEYRVQPDGSINFPFIERVDVSNKEPQEIALTIKARLAEKRILTNPQVSVVMKAYNSKRITVVGQVARPGTVPWAQGLKLVEAIAQSGGMTPVADSNHVILTRSVTATKTVTAIISVDAITDGAQGDIPLQAGDTIKVESKSF